MQITATPDGWLHAVLNDFDTFLKDHASCEKKASGMALNIASHYPDKPDLLTAMADLAVEELSHYREVVRLLLERGLTPGPDQRDPYIRELNSLIRRGAEFYLLDRLLIAAIVERRGCERFGLVAQAIDQNDPQQTSLAAFYRAITTSEARHWELFLELAKQQLTEQEGEDDAISQRLAELLEGEAQIMQAQPFRACLH